MDKNVMIIAEGHEYSLDCFSTKLNNNVIVVGGSGAGKTTSVVEPNIVQATGSYIVTDPKGNLYRKLGPFLRENGYKVMSLDLTNPNGKVRYNFFDYIKSEHDVIKIAHILMSGAGSKSFSGDNAFFYQTAELMVASAISMIKYGECYDGKEMELKTLEKILTYCTNTLRRGTSESEYEENDIWSDLSRRLKCTIGKLPDDTASSVSATIGSVLGKLNTSGVEAMMTAKWNKLDLESIGNQKTALFVRVSDTDRSMDIMANIFFTQAIGCLCNYADTKCKNNALPIPVRFIMDDFATNCTIEDFPRMISSIRSRNISTMILLQAESQLEDRYGKEAFTITSNCDTYLYMGGNDLETAKRVAERADIPFRKILNMPIGTCWIFRRGQEPICAKNYDFAYHFKEMIANKKTIKPRTSP